MYPLSKIGSEIIIVEKPLHNSYRNYFSEWFLLAGLCEQSYTTSSLVKFLFENCTLRKCSSVVGCTYVLCRRTLNTWYMGLPPSFSVHLPRRINQMRNYDSHKILHWNKFYGIVLLLEFTNLYQFSTHCLLSDRQP